MSVPQQCLSARAALWALNRALPLNWCRVGPYRPCIITADLELPSSPTSGTTLILQRSSSLSMTIRVNADEGAYKAWRPCLFLISQPIISHSKNHNVRGCCRTNTADLNGFTPANVVFEPHTQTSFAEAPVDTGRKVQHPEVSSGQSFCHPSPHCWFVSQSLLSFEIANHTHGLQGCSGLREGMSESWVCTVRS